ncbi:MAG TPA: CPBP family intramembrane glutamic endopeptidase [Thermoplasmata archaeon]|nr:CPBP family intramembrane glutamic endopeptidase [Thermoplasmata archaeon]
MKGPLAVSLVVLAYFIAVAALVQTSGGPLPQQLTLDVVARLLANAALGYGPLLLALIGYEVWVERRRSVREIFVGLGFRSQGARRSLLWSIGLFPVYAVVSVLTLMVASYTAPPSGGGTIPGWYPYYLVVDAFFPVAVVEEAFGRGFLLDRLMPAHPSGLLQAVPAILLSSLLFTLYHVPYYLAAYSFSPAHTLLLLAVNVFPLSILLAGAYVRSRARNVAGPVLIHFLLDALPYVLFVVL